MSLVGASLRSSGITVDKQSVLRLYKQLLRYSDKLKFTDKQYYLGRVQAEFRRNQTLEGEKDIEFYYKIVFFFSPMHLNLFSLLRSGKLYLRAFPDYRIPNFASIVWPIKIKTNLSVTAKSISTTHLRYKFVPDKSKIPTLNENDIEEQFVSGSGPGGQNVNRLQNCVVLRHLPTGIVVKCHKDRQLHRNRKLARELLIDHLDQHINGEDSLAEQKKRYVIATSISYEKKAAELRARKKAYKESLKEIKSTDTQSDSPSPDLSSSEEEVANLKP